MTDDGVDTDTKFPTWLLPVGWQSGGSDWAWAITVNQVFPLPFPFQKRPDGAFQIVELRILSNWGHPEYTCLYRFRVHGEPVE